MTQTRKALVIGATGGVGGAIAEALLRHGWHVRGLARDVEAARPTHPKVEWLHGDAMVQSDVVQAAAGASAIIHAVNRVRSCCR